VCLPSYIPVASGAACRFDIRFSSDPDMIRAALKAVSAETLECGLAPDRRAQLELVLAEVLNNVAEHAYRGRPDGCIELRMEYGDPVLHFSVEDLGVPMPGGTLPAGNAPPTSVDTPDMPEGGFGWFIIRQLVDDISYQCHEGRNVLRFCMTVGTLSCATVRRSSCL